jgi:type I restriction enzyme S subunit
MPQKLPKGWVKTTLGEVYVPSRLRVLPADAGNLPYIGMEHVESQTMRLLGHNESAELKSSSLRFNKGDVLYGKMRPYLNKVWVAEFDGLCSAEFLIFPKTGGLNNQFLAYRLNTQDFVAFANLNVSGERPRVGFEKLCHFTYLLAPSREQDRIVAKLDALLSRVAAGEAAARRAIDRLQRYRIAVLHAAVTGELTRNWRKTHGTNQSGTQLLKQLLSERRIRWEGTELSRLKAAGKSPKDEKWKKRYPIPRSCKTTQDWKLPRGWTWATVEQVSMRVTVGHVGPMKTEYVRRGVPFLRSQNVRANRFDPTGLLYIRRSFHEKLSKSRIFPGDVVIVRSGNVGTACVIPKSLGEANCADLVLVQRPLINPHLLSFYMNSIGQEQVAAGKVGVAITHFNTGSVAGLAIAVPPENEQAQIVREAERRLKAADRLATTLSHQLERARVTRQSLLRQAFSGKLVRQDSDDEPAYHLLRRIRAIRAAETNKVKAKRMPKSKLKSVDTLGELETLLNRLGRGATPNRLLIAAGLSDNVEKFFDLLREGRDTGRLIVPVGTATLIRRVQHAN